MSTWLSNSNGIVGDARLHGNRSDVAVRHVHRDGFVVLGVQGPPRAGWACQEVLADHGTVRYRPVHDFARFFADHAPVQPVVAAHPTSCGGGPHVPRVSDGSGQNVFAGNMFGVDAHHDRQLLVRDPQRLARPRHVTGAIEGRAGMSGTSSRSRSTTTPTARSTSNRSLRMNMSLSKKQISTNVRVIDIARALTGHPRVWVTVLSARQRCTTALSETADR